MCGEANNQSPGLPYGESCFHAKRDSAVCASSGTSFRDASVFGAPSTIATTGRRICKTRFSKSTFLPPKPYQFSSAQPSESIQLDHRPEWIWQFLEECHDFFRSQNVWCFLPFRALANTRDWILLGPLPPDRMRIERAHNVSDLRPAAPR